MDWLILFVSILVGLGLGGLAIYSLLGVLMGVWKITEWVKGSPKAKRIGVKLLTLLLTCLILSIVIFLGKALEREYNAWKTNKEYFESCKRRCNRYLRKNKDKPEWRLCREDCRLEYNYD